MVEKQPIGIIVSGGGHLDEALEVMEAFKGHDVFLVCYRLEALKHFSHPGIKRIHFVTLLASSGPGLYVSLIMNIFQVLRIFIKERPGVLFSTGSEITIAPFVLGKFLFGARTIFLETVTRVHEPSRTARMVGGMTDLFLVQWETLLGKVTPKAKYAGRVL